MTVIAQAAPVTALSFVTQAADETLDLWPQPPAESYAQACKEGQRRAAEFVTYLQESRQPCGLLFALTTAMGLPKPTGPERGYLAGFLFAIEAELSRHAWAPPRNEGG